MTPSGPRRRARTPRPLTRWLGLGVLAAFVVLINQIGLDTVRRAAEAVPDWVALILLVLLPLGGFPVSVLHIAAGLKFGTGPGLLWVLASILLQLGISHPVGRWVGRRRPDWIAPLVARVPEGAHALKCVFVMLLPGVPYWLKNYALPAAGVPLVTYLAWCAPFHGLNSVVGVALGGENEDLTGMQLGLMAGYFFLMTAGAWVAWRRLQARVQAPPGGEDDPMRPKQGRSSISRLKSP